MPGQTATVSYSSELARKAWIKEGLIGAREQSQFAPFTGLKSSSVVMQSNRETAKAGETVVFDFDGYLVNGPVRGKETARGTGEQKRKFSDTLVIDRFRFVVDNGDEFDASKIGSLDLTTHADSRTKLASKFIKFKDQAIIDVAQQGITHKIQTSTLTFDDILDISNIVKTGKGYDVGAKRMPLTPFTTDSSGKPMWLFIVDSDVKTMIMRSTGAQSVLKEIDVRGNENRLISGVLGKIGNLVIVEFSQFFGVQKASNIIVDSDGYAAMNEIAELQWQGLRQYKDNGTTTFAPVQWSGFSGFDAASGNLYSRCLIMGAAAVQQAYGLAPDYKWKSSEDFDINSESCLEMWMGTKICSMTAENSDYSTKVANISNGAIAIDVKIP